MAAESPHDRPVRKPRRLPEPQGQIPHLPRKKEDTAHRLKNMLASIMARISILKMDDRIPDDISDELKDIAETCLEAAELVDEMNRDIKREKAA